MAAWRDLIKLFRYAFSKDPMSLAKKDGGFISGCCLGIRGGPDIIAIPDTDKPALNIKLKKDNNE